MNFLLQLGRKIRNFPKKYTKYMDHSVKTETKDRLEKYTIDETSKGHQFLFAQNK